MSQEVEGIKDRASILLNFDRESKALRARRESLLSAQSIEPLTECLRRHDEFFSYVSEPAALAQDCETFKSITEIAVNQVASVSLGSHSVSYSGVLSKLARKFDDNGKLNLKVLGSRMLRKGKTAPVLHPILYGLEEKAIAPKVRSQRQHTPRDVIEEAAEVAVRDTTETKTSHFVARAKKLCERLERMGAVRIDVVISTADGFAKSIENAFDLAHLVRDGKVALKREGDTVVAFAADEKEQKVESRRQCILHLRKGCYNRPTPQR